MPPFRYWPHRPWDVVYSPTAFDHSVAKKHIKYIISVPVNEVRLHSGKPSVHDERYSGGKQIVCATIAQGILPNGRGIEVGLRQDFRKPGEVCRVFHARYP